jgi:hypothetical protein
MTGRLSVTYISGYLYNLGNVYISRLTQTWGQLLSDFVKGQPSLKSKPDKESTVY